MATKYTADAKQESVAHEQRKSSNKRPADEHEQNRQYRCAPALFAVPRPRVQRGAEVDRSGRHEGASVRDIRRIEF